MRPTTLKAEPGGEWIFISCMLEFMVIGFLILGAWRHDLGNITSAFLSYIMARLFSCKVAKDREHEIKQQGLSYLSR